MIIEKNDNDQFFSNSDNVMAITDGDVFSELRSNYEGLTKIFCSPVQDLELYIFENRDELLPDVNQPPLS